MSMVLVDKKNLTQQLVEGDGVVERQRMIESMCLTWRHDFGLSKPEDCEFSSGMTAAEREHLRGQMAKLFDHHFGPALSAVTAERDRLLAFMERVEKHAEYWWDDPYAEVVVGIVQEWRETKAAAMAAKEE